MRTVVMIPARHASTRFPGKPLALLRQPDGTTQSLIEMSWRAAGRIGGVDAVLVATDDDGIRVHAEGFGAQVVMTAPDCENGTARCAAALGFTGPGLSPGTGTGLASGASEGVTDGETGTGVSPDAGVDPTPGTGAGLASDATERGSDGKTGTGVGPASGTGTGIGTETGAPSGPEPGALAGVLSGAGVEADLIVNFQGDAPLTPPWFVEDLIAAMAADPGAQVATPVVRCDAQTYAMFLEDRRRGRVGGTTAVFDRARRALYFSKEIVPYIDPARLLPGAPPVYHHVGVYAYRPRALAAYVGWAQGPLERLEGLEQLRFLENGCPVLCVEVAARGRVFWELNNPTDVARIEAILARAGPERG